jgi:hypothetical protein
MNSDNRALKATCSPKLHLPVQIILLAIIFFVPLVIMREKSATYDEVAHLPAGFSYLTTGLVRLNPQHPPLIKEICAFPLLFLGPGKLVDRRKLESEALEPNYEWEYGRKFLFGQDADRLLFWGRVPAVLLSLGLAGLIMIWAKRLWGGPASLLALSLYAFDPTITAHAQLVTTDVGFAFFATLFLFILRRYLQQPSPRWLILSGSSLGLALGAKFSAVILVPVAAFIMLLAARAGQSYRIDVLGAPAGETGTQTRVELWNASGCGKRLLAAVVVISLMTVTAVVVLWVIYIFPADPLIYLKGLGAVNHDHDPNFPYYLKGAMRPGGWRSYFLVAWLIKTPIPSLLLFMLSIVFFVKGRRAFWLDELFLVVPALAFFVGYSLTADNIGIRYLIPCSPFFIIFTARILAEAVTSKPTLRVTLAVLLSWYLVEFMAIYPDHLSYFNQIAGGYRHGPEWLDDSNVDWGQGLIQLREYLRSHKLEDYSLCYFGSGDPQYYGIPKRNVTNEVSLPPPRGRTLILSGHYVARIRALAPSLAQGWPSSAVPKVVVGHAYYIYDF